MAVLKIDFEVSVELPGMNIGLLGQAFFTGDNLIIEENRLEFHQQET